MDIEFSAPGSGNGQTPMDIARRREELAKLLREKHPGEWAVVSKGHTSRGAARQVRDRIRGRGYFADFEWAVRRDPDNPELHVIYAAAPGGVRAPEPVEVELADSATFEPTPTY